MRMILQKGITLVEMLVVIAILGFLGGIVMAFQTDVFSFNKLFTNNLDVQREGLLFLRKFTGEIRSMVPSETGTYPFATVGTSTLTFFVDADDDGVAERVRYYLDGTVLYRAVLIPTGSPLAYVGSETITTAMNYVQNEATTTPLAIFTYYDETYTGFSGSELAQPVVASDVRLVKATFLLDVDSADAQPEIILTTNAMARNLKDNL